MKKLYIYFISSAMLVACCKKDPIPTITIEKQDLLGGWSGKYLLQTTNKPLEEGIDWYVDVKNNDSVTVYLGEAMPNPSGIIARGKWSIIDNKAFMYSILPGNTAYTVVGTTLNNQKNRLIGYFFQADDPTQKYNFFLDKKSQR